MKILFLIFFFTSHVFASAPDISKKFGIGGGLGRDLPVGGNKFDDRARGECVSGIYGRYQLTQSSGLIFGYTRYEWSRSPTAARVYDVVYMYRVASKHWVSPIFGAGIGAVDIAHYNVDENLKLGLKARSGVEFILNKNMLIDAAFDYQFVNRMIGEQDNLTIGEMHILAAEFMVSYLF
ncbi:MAG: hypothetical protein AB7I27_03660 [Bacteriovoracaceae bacterium]